VGRFYANVRSWSEANSCADAQRRGRMANLRDEYIIYRSPKPAMSVTRRSLKKIKRAGFDLLEDNLFNRAMHD
jgi:hypothetical protein